MFVASCVAVSSNVVHVVVVGRVCSECSEFALLFLLFFLSFTPALHSFLTPLSHLHTRYTHSAALIGDAERKEAVFRGEHDQTIKDHYNELKRRADAKREQTSSKAS